MKKKYNHGARSFLLSKMIDKLERTHTERHQTRNPHKQTEQNPKLATANSLSKNGKTIGVDVVGGGGVYAHVGGIFNTIVCCALNITSV